MMLRTAASLLLRTAIRLSPESAKEWSRAMLAELDHVEGSWKALRWSLGCASVLTRQAAQEFVMRKPTLITASASIAVLLVFVLMPTFRQAVRASTFGWTTFLVARQPETKSRDLWPDRNLRSLKAAAENAGDAKALAFVAERLRDTTESARLAEEAVRLDPSLTWVLGVVGVRHPYPFIPNLDRWVIRLHEWDPDNALPYLLIAERNDIQSTETSRRPLPKRRDQEWRDAMAAALASKHVDDYLTQQLEMDRNVARHYHFLDPNIFFDGLARFRVPSYAASDVFVYVDPKKPFDARAFLWRAETPLSANSVVRYFQEQMRHGTTQPEGPLSLSIGMLVNQIAALAMFGFAALLLAWIAISRMRGSAAGLIGTVGLFVSAATVYIGYLPYARTFEQFLNSTDASQLDSLRTFYWVQFQVLPFAVFAGRNPLLTQTHLWMAVIAVCVVALVCIGVRYMPWNSSRRKPSSAVS